MPHSTTMRDAVYVVWLRAGFSVRVAPLRGASGCAAAYCGKRYAEGSSAFFSLSAVIRFRGTCVVHT